MEPRPLTILAIDDDPGDIELLRRHIEDLAEFAITFVSCANIEAGRLELSNRDVDVIILDYLFGPHTGLALLQELRDEGDGRPIIMLTGKGDERIAAQAMRVGADDYLVKEDLCTETIYRSLRFVLERFQHDQERVQHEAELIRMARYDELTGVYNRRYLIERLTEETLRAGRYGSPLCILMIDVDHFKRINDTYGHIVGDTVLATVAGLLHETVRATDITGRYGGEEFCIVLTETDLAGGHNVAERLRERIAARTFTAPDGGSFHVTCSIGLAQFDRHLEDIVGFLELADRALYDAKTSGRDRVALAAAGAK